MNRNLITALILASGFLLTSEQEKDQYKPQLPNFKDILEVKHSIKGRIRIQCKVLKGNQHGEQALLNTFSQIPGIIDISVNPCIGTVIIKYNEETIQPMLIIGIILKVLGLEDEAHNENKYILYFCHQNALLLNPLWNNSSKYSLPYKIYLLMFFKTILSVIHCNTTY